MRKWISMISLFFAVSVMTSIADEDNVPAGDGYYMNQEDLPIGPDGQPIQPGPEAMNPNSIDPEGVRQENWRRERRPEMMTETGDIVMDYRSLVQQIDDMRAREEETLRRLDDLARRYEDVVNQLEDLEKKWEATADEFKHWAEESQEKMEKMNASWAEPTEVRGQVHGAPSDRYTTN